MNKHPWIVLFLAFVMTACNAKPVVNVVATETPSIPLPVLEEQIKWSSSYQYIGTMGDDIFGPDQAQSSTEIEGGLVGLLYQGKALKTHEIRSLINQGNHIVKVTDLKETLFPDDQNPYKTFILKGDELGIVWDYPWEQGEPVKEYLTLLKSVEYQAYFYTFEEGVISEWRNVHGEYSPEIRVRLINLGNDLFYVENLSTNIKEIGPLAKAWGIWLSCEGSAKLERQQGWLRGTCN